MSALDGLPMHYWPSSASGLPALACGVKSGLRSSDATSVTCPACRPLASVAEHRQQAFEALLDARSSIAELPSLVDPVRVAIEVASTVKITHEVVMAFIETPDDPDNIIEPLKAAFRAAGIEVAE